MQTVKTTFVVILLLTVLYGAHAVLTQPAPKPPREAADAVRDLVDLDFDLGDAEEDGTPEHGPATRPSDSPPTMAGDASPLIPPPTSFAARETEPSDAEEPIETAPPAPPEPGRLAPVPTIPDLAPRGDAVAESNSAAPSGLAEEGPSGSRFAPPGPPPTDVAAGGSTIAPPPETDTAPEVANDANASRRFAPGAPATESAAPAGGAGFPALPDPRDTARSIGGELDRAVGQVGATVDREARNAQDALAKGRDSVEGIRFDPKEALLSRGWKAAQESLKANDYRQALATLSAVYEDPRLSHQERQRLLDSLDPLAARVIYSTEHLLEPAYEVRRGDTLMTVAEKYNVPWQLLRNINGVADPEFLVPGSKLKVVRGPFRAEVDTSLQEMTVYLQKLYAGRFPLNVGNDPAPQQGDFEVQRKDAGRPFYASNGVALPAGDPRNPYGRCWIDLGGNVSIHGTALEGGGPTTSGCVSLSPRDAEDVFAILSVGSRVSIR